MIFPGNIYSKKLDFNFSPAWMLVVVNVMAFIFVIILFAEPLKKYQQSDDNKSFDQRMTKVTLMYKQTLDPLQLETFNPKDTQSIIQDSKFWLRSQNFPFKGDAIEIEKTKTFLAQLRSDYYKSPQYLFGLSSNPTTVWAWLTYQFMHTGFLHLVMNLLFLVLVVAQLQKAVSASWIYAVYILSGLGGGIAYLWMNQFNEIAVLGASGAICGLMSYLSVTHYNKNIEWSYFLSPLPGYYGVMHMPAYLLFPIYLISDFTTVLYFNTGVQSSVAHSAHIGGTFVGFSLGIIYLLDLQSKKKILKVWGQHLSDKDYEELRDRVS